MAAVSSGYVQIDITATTGDTTLPIRLTGDFQTPDCYHLTMELRGIVKLWEVIVIDEDFYSKSLPNGAWEAGAEAAGLSLSEAQLNGERVYRVGGAVTGDTLAELLGDSSVQDGKGDVGYWIGAEDFLVRRAEIKAELPTRGGSTKSEIVMTISDYGKPVDIEAPES